MRFFEFLDLKYNNLTTQINNYLRTVFNRSDESFSNASPYGQIINVSKELFQQNVLYQKNVVKNLTITEADNAKSVRNLSRIGGHNPTRAISASGVITLKLKPGNLLSNISGGKLKINDKSKIKNKTNGFIYSIKLGGQQEIYEISQVKDINLNIIQGSYETYTFTGNGEINQSFSVNANIGNTIENFEIEIKYNNEPLSIKEHMFDMLKNEKSCFVRTGMSGGIDVYFGNGNFGFVPLQGSLITVNYLISNGVNGIILTPQFNDFQFIDNITDMIGQTVNIEEIFDIVCENQISFASNGETIDFTKSIMPFVSRNFVLSTPSQYIYTLKRLNMFSKINAYNTLNDNNLENDDIVYLFLIPNIKNYFNNDVNYFNVPIDAFYLDENEKSKTLTYLNKMANIPPATVIEILQPTLSYYIMNIYVRKYYGYSDEYIKQNIINEVSTYLSNLDRDDRIPKSDIISTLENIDGVDSINVFFISKKNEDYHKLKPNSDYIYGIDPVLGDIVVESNELAIIRGGWSDRNYTYYNENINGDSLGPINIIFVGVTEENINI